MDFATRKKYRAVWHKARWIVLVVAAAAVVFGVVYLRNDVSRSRWYLSHDENWTIFVEHLVPRENAQAFKADFPGKAIDWYDSLGLMLPSPHERELVVFATWADYASLGMDDPAIYRTLKKENSGDLLYVSMMAGEFRLNEPVADCFVSSDGRFLFLDLKGDAEVAAIHGLAHVLARDNVPPAVGDRMDLSKAFEYDPKEVRAFHFVEETAALFLSDLYLSGAKGLTPSDFEQYSSFVAKRYAADGPIFTDANLTFAFSSDPRTPRSFAASARFALAVAGDKGLVAMADWAARVLRGDYKDLYDLCAPLGGSLADCLEKYLGDSEIPE